MIFLEWATTWSSFECFPLCFRCQNESVSSPLLDSVGNSSSMIDDGKAGISFSILASEIDLKMIES